MISFSTFDIISILVVVGLVLLVAAAGVILPLVAAVLFFRGHRTIGLYLGITGLAALAFSAGPPVYERFRFNRDVSRLPELEVVRNVPDLTGKTVAILMGGGLSVYESTISGRTCLALLRHSGAENVYILDPDALGPQSREQHGNWLLPMDLSELVIGRVILSGAWIEGPPADPDLDGTCSFVPLAQPLQPIDYLWAEEISFYTDGYLQDLVYGPHALPQGSSVYLEALAMPVGDEHAFVLNGENADLLMLRLTASVSDYPYPFGSSIMHLPENASEQGKKAVWQALCRHGQESCRLQP